VDNSVSTPFDKIPRDIIKAMKNMIDKTENYMHDTEGYVFYVSPKGDLAELKGVMGYRVLKDYYLPPNTVYFTKEIINN
jgi:hypothetical protein